MQTIHKPQDAKNNILQRCKERRKMWKGVLEFCNLKTLANYGKWIQSTKS
jgi:hypothetical protein